jgi:flagellar motor protein MotB
MSDHFKSKFSTQSQVHDEGEPWLISYADMVTLLLGFFVMLYSFSKVDERKFEAVQQALAGTFKSDVKNKARDKKEVVNESVSRQERALKIIASMMNIDDLDRAMSKIEGAAVAGRVQRETLAALSGDLERIGGSKAVMPTDAAENTVELVIPSGILYNAQGNRLTPDQVHWLRNLGRTLAKMTALVDVDIQGHQIPVAGGSRGSVSAALTSSASTAALVADEMIKGGLNTRFVRISSLGFGQPIAAANAPGAVTDNHRLHIVIRRRVTP